MEFHSRVSVTLSALSGNLDRNAYLDFGLQGRNIFRGSHVQNPSATQIFESHRYVDYNLIGACDVDARWGRFLGSESRGFKLGLPRAPRIFRERVRGILERASRFHCEKTSILLHSSLEATSCESKNSGQSILIPNELTGSSTEDDGSCPK
jgi:hypothetical protein